MKYRYLLLPLAASLSACAMNAAETTPVAAAKSVAVSEIADAYIRLTLEAGTHEAEYVDAYYGPARLHEAAKANPRGLAALIDEARSQTAAIDAALPKLTVDADRRRAFGRTV